MPTQDIIWTVLPNGFRRDGARLVPRISLFVSARLILDGSATTGTLRPFPDFLDWPARVRSRGFTLVTGSGREIPARVVTDPQADTASWKALFGPETLVKSHRQDELAQHYFPHPAGAVSQSLSRGYADLLQKSPHAPSSNEALAAAFPELDRAIRRRTAPGAPSIDDRLANHTRLTAPEMEGLQREILDDLLGRDAEAELAEKLSAASLIARTRSRLPGNRLPVPVVPDGGDPASAFAQLAAFHHVPLAGTATTPPEPPAPADDKRLDFHQMLAALAEYPYLMRRLGLVIDLEIDAQSLPVSEPGRPDTLRVKLAAGGTDRVTVTHYLFHAQPAGNHRLPFAHFVACPRAWGSLAPSTPLPPDSRVEILGGLLNCAIEQPDDPGAIQFNLLQVDIDGAGLKLINSMKSIASAQDAAQPIDGAVQGGAPTLRTRGIAVTRTGNAADLLGKVPLAFDHEDALRAGSAPAFFAEDLVRGYRVDVRPFPSDYRVGSPPPPSARWHSLHKRIGSFALPPASSGALTFRGIADEGFAQPALSQGADGSGGDHGALRAPESLANWRGWSLAASPPLSPDGGVLQQAAGTSPVLPGLPEVEIKFEPEPKSLPRLRFGQYYQVRMRVADLAGNGLTPAEADDMLSALRASGRTWPVLFEKAEDFFRYRRFEPIDAPAVVPRADLGDGESEATLVIRGLGAPRPGPMPGGLRLNGDTERHVAPPQASLATAEAHGVLDGAFGAAGNPRAHYAICLRESGTFNDRAIVSLQTGRPEPLPDVPVRDPATGAQTVVPNGIKSVLVGGGADSRQRYSIHYEEQLRLPYLPDPMARGAALFGLPGVGVVEGSGQLVGDRIEWLLPQGELLPEDARKALGYVTKIGFGNSANWLDRLPFRLRLKAIDAGALPPKPEWDASKRMLTVCLPPGEQKDIWLSSYPEADSTLVLGIAKWWLADRIGPGAALPADRRHFINTAPHGALSLISPARKLTLVHAVLRPVHPPREAPAGSFTANKLVDPTQPRDHPTFVHIGGQFKIHAKSTAKIDLLATWKEPGAGPGGAEYRTISTHVLEIPVHLDKPALPAATGQVASHAQKGDDLTFLAPTVPADARAKRYLSRHEFGDTKYRKVTYKLLATSRFPEHFPKSVTDDVEAITCHTEIVKDILSSAPPAAPEVSCIVPAQKFLPTDDIGTTSSSRRGGALRVFLGGSWHSSGDGEMLALVDPESGADPIHQAGSVADGIKPDAGEVQAQGRKIYPFKPAYDKQTGLWYGDILFKSQEHYFPFVKLALARYQPKSLPGMELSTIVHAGFHQLLPDRNVSLVHSGGGSQIDVTVTGFRPSQTANARIRYLILVSLEERDVRRQDWDPDLGWTSAAQQPVATPAGDALWRGKVALTSTGDDRQRRLVIKEFELFPANDCAEQQWPGPRPPELAGFSARLVYADTIGPL